MMSSPSEALGAHVEPVDPTELAEAANLQYQAAIALAKAADHAKSAGDVALAELLGFQTTEVQDTAEETHARCVALWERQESMT